MGCVSSRQARHDAFSSPDSSALTTTRDGRKYRRSRSSLGHRKVGFGGLEKIQEESEEGEEECCSPAKKNPKALSKVHSARKAAFSFKFGRLTEGEHAAAGWPSWLSAVAGEAVEGWLPLRADKFQRLEKIGQGTYSSVYRARDLENGKMVALKKVRFDNFQPESVRFMAREITVLRRLDHPNIMKLEGIITSRSSCSICLVFEYMEHDLSGLLSCPDIKFNDSQIKCFMKQLLSGLEHCHSRGVMHRDIKVSNILVNNEGILKIGDFGLATFVSAKNNRQPLTSRVVTLWYRPPELLLGSTDYGVTVDLWSAGCVFAELFFGKPLLKGRTEYFYTRPYACDPSSMPIFPPNREIDAKLREEARRRKTGSTVRGGSGYSRNKRTRRGVASTEDMESSYHTSRRSNGKSTCSKGATVARMSRKTPYDTFSEAASQTTEVSQGDSICSVPVQTISSYDGWPKSQRLDRSGLHAYANSRRLKLNPVKLPMDPSDAYGQEI